MYLVKIVNKIVGRVLTVNQSPIYDDLDSPQKQTIALPVTMSFFIVSRGENVFPDFKVSDVS